MRLREYYKKNDEAILRAIDMIKSVKNRGLDVNDVEEYVDAFNDIIKLLEEHNFLLSGSSDELIINKAKRDLNIMGKFPKNFKTWKPKFDKFMNEMNCAILSDEDAEKMDALIRKAADYENRRYSCIVNVELEYGQISKESTLAYLEIDIFKREFCLKNFHNEWYQTEHKRIIQSLKSLHAFINENYRCDILVKTALCYIMEMVDKYRDSGTLEWYCLNIDQQERECKEYENISQHIELFKKMILKFIKDERL